MEEVRKCSKWDNDDFICPGHILNGKVDSLFDVYQFIEYTKELLESLEGNYVAEDTTTSGKNFLVSSFNDYKIVNARPIIDQFHEIQSIYTYLKQDDIKMEEFFVV